MALTRDIPRAWRAPRVVMRELLAQGRREDRAIFVLMLACFLIFVVQWPRLARKAAGFDLAPGAEVPEMTQLLSYELMAWVMIWPLMFYGIAAVLHIVAKVFGGQGSFFSARMALFWSLLASTPMLMLHGLTAGLVGPGVQTDLVGALWAVGFLWIFSQSFLVAEFRPDAEVRA